MSDTVLGKLTNVTQGRDAIHIAIISMKASETLRAGQRVGIVSDGVAGPSSKIVGIVDPFLTDVVPKGAMFWLCLLPNTVTGMRHHWSHPDFDSKNDSLQNQMSKETAASVAWLKDAAKVLGVTYEDMVDVNSPLVTGDYINNGERIRDLWYSYQDEFWHHYKIVTGRDVPEKDRGGFTCSC